MSTRYSSLPAVRPGGWPGHAVAIARTLGFWAAVVLPLAYLPLIAFGPAPASDPTVIGTVIGVNLVAIVVGHGHEP